MIYDLIIIGAGPAGLTAGIYAGRKKLKTAILTKQIGGQSLSYTIENYPGLMEISGLELVEKTKKQVEKYDMEIKESAEISAIDKKNGNFSVKTERGDSFEAKAIIIASGKMPKKIKVPGAREFEGKGVSFCTICDAPLFAGKSVAVIGGGNAALMAAMDLIPYAEKIYVLQHRERFIGDEILQEKLKNSGKVEFITDAETREIKGKNFVDKIIYEDLKTGEKKELAVGGVFVNIGYIPNTSFVKNFLKLNEKEEIIIDPWTGETSIKGIFAAGDATNIPYKQYVVAAAEGAKAALSAYYYICNC
ncbi:MAG: FAD-dependent oxidoreductase [Candidatus Tagabacteria bacterium]